MLFRPRELIETLWNVNDCVVNLDGEPSFELIETLWNVNKLAMLENFTLMLELIETLWNVNFIHSVFSFLPLLGINRNIVECKLCGAASCVRRE